MEWTNSISQKIQYCKIFVAEHQFIVKAGAFEFLLHEKKKKKKKNYFN